MPSYLLLERFRNLFDGVQYRHRNATLGDSVARYLPEDLYALRLSSKLNGRIDLWVRVLDLKNQARGIHARRGDSTFGELIPHAAVVRTPGFAVPRGPIATVEVGTEVKILAKAMIKQIDRVIGDLTKQVQQFRTAGGNPICIGVVGINHADRYVSFEKDRAWPTDGRKYKHPIQEAPEAEARLRARAAPAFDEFLVLRFRAWNQPPFRFQWVDAAGVQLDYGAILTRAARAYDARF